MSIPSNTVATSGTGAPAITADNFNTYVQTVNTLTAARGFSGSQYMQISLQGYSSANDGGQGNFVWVLGTGTDDGGITTIVPTGNTSGYWSRLTNSSVVYTPQSVNNTSGNVTLTAANVVNQVMVCSGGTAPTNTFPTAAAIIAAMPGQQAGATRILNVINENSGTMLLAPGSGVTFSGNLSTGNFSLSTATSKLLTIYIASATAVTVYG